MNAVDKTEKRATGARWALILGVSAAFIAMSGAALAEKGRGRFGGGPKLPGMAVMRAFSELELTEQQELQAIRIRRNLQAEATEARKEMAGSMTVVASELQKASPDAVKLHGIVDQAVARFQKLAHSAIDQVLALHATLTPDQRNTLAERLRTLEERRAERREGKRSPKK